MLSFGHCTHVLTANEQHKMKPTGSLHPIRKHYLDSMDFKKEEEEDGQEVERAMSWCMGGDVIKMHCLHMQNYHRINTRQPI